MRLNRLVLPIITALALLLAGGGLTAWFYIVKQTELIESAEADLIGAGRETVQEMDALFHPVVAFQEVIADANFADLPVAEIIRPFFALAQNPVRAYPQVNGIYLGFPDGSFLHVQEFLPQALRAAAGNAIDEGRGSRRIIRRDIAVAEEIWSYRAANGGEWLSLPPAPPQYDPRSRPWYAAALQSDTGIWTEPYVFSSTGKLGVTYAVALRRRDGGVYAVLGMDLTLEALSSILDAKSRDLAGREGLIFATDIGDKVVGHPAIRPSARWRAAAMSISAACWRVTATIRGWSGD